MDTVEWSVCTGSLDKMFDTEIRERSASYSSGKTSSNSMLILSDPSQLKTLQVGATIVRMHDHKLIPRDLGTVIEGNVSIMHFWKGDKERSQRSHTKKVNLGASAWTLRRLPSTRNAVSQNSDSGPLPPPSLPCGTKKSGVFALTDDICTRCFPTFDPVSQSSVGVCDQMAANSDCVQKTHMILKYPIVACLLFYIVVYRKSTKA